MLLLLLYADQWQLQAANDMQIAAESLHSMGDPERAVQMASKAREWLEQWQLQSEAQSRNSSHAQMQAIRMPKNDSSRSCCGPNRLLSACCVGEARAYAVLGH